MIAKYPLCPERLRRIPPSFSWVDHRLVRHGYFQQGSPESLLLYFFLVIVGDAQGLSYYSETALARHLRLTGATLSRARDELIARQLIAYRHPLYQVLELPVAPPPSSPVGAATPAAMSPHPPASRSDQPQPVGAVLARLLTPNNKENRHD